MPRSYAQIWDDARALAEDHVDRVEDDVFENAAREMVNLRKVGASDKAIAEVTAIQILLNSLRRLVREHNEETVKTRLPSFKVIRMRRKKNDTTG